MHTFQRYGSPTYEALIEVGVVITGLNEEVFHVMKSLSTLVLKPIPCDCRPIPYNATPLKST